MARQGVKFIFTFIFINSKMTKKKRSFFPVIAKEGKIIK